MGAAIPVSDRMETLIAIEGVGRDDQDVGNSAWLNGAKRLWGQY